MNRNYNIRWALQVKYQTTLFLLLLLLPTLGRAFDLHQQGTKESFNEAVISARTTIRHEYSPGFSGVNINTFEFSIHDPDMRKLNFQFDLNIQYRNLSEFGMQDLSRPYWISDFMGETTDLDLLSVALVYRLKRKSLILQSEVAEPEYLAQVGQVFSDQPLFTFGMGMFSLTVARVMAGTPRSNISLEGLNLDTAGVLPLSEKISLIGRAGLNFSTARDAFSGDELVNEIYLNPNKIFANFKAGLGLQFDLTESFGMRAEVEQYWIKNSIGSKGNGTLFSIGLVYRF